MENKNINYSYDDYIYNEIDDLDTFENSSVALWKQFKKSKEPVNPEDDYEDDFYENYPEDNTFSDGDSDIYDYDYDKWID